MRILFCWLLFVTMSLSISAQEDLYIKFEPRNGDVYKGDNIEVWFHIQPKIDASFFIYNKSLGDKKTVYKDQIDQKLISKTEANERVKEIMTKRVERYEKETGESWQAIINPPYPFDALFKNIYIFVPDSAGEKGILYPVSWQYAIE